MGISQLNGDDIFVPMVVTTEKDNTEDMSEPAP